MPSVLSSQKCHKRERNMSTEEVPSYIQEIHKSTFRDRELDNLRRELVASMKDRIIPSAVVWEEMKKHSDRLKSETEDYLWKECSWILHAIELISKLEYYKKLKEEEIQKFADFVMKISKRVADIELELSSKDDEPKESDVNTIKAMAAELKIKLPLRKTRTGEESVYGELIKNFGMESASIVEKVVTELEEESNERK